MADRTLEQLLAGNAQHVDSLPEGYFDDVRAGQRPAAVSVCCSDSRVSQTGMWSVDEPGWLFTPSTIGNQVWDRHDGQRVVDGSVLYPMVATGTKVVAVVGHTGCGAVTAALEAVTEGGVDGPPGVRKRVESLVPVVERGLEAGLGSEDDAATVNRLVEHNVDEQVSFLLASEDVPDGVRVYGFVYDFQEVYGDADGRVYLVNADGDQDPETLRDRIPKRFSVHVSRLSRGA